MLTFTFQTHATSGKNLPLVKIETNPTCPVIEIPDGVHNVSFDTEDSGSFVLNFFNKTENDTIVDELTGQIVSDTQFRFSQVWCNNIKLESWFLTDAVYKPQYFSGFLEQNPEAPEEINSPYQFNFPGLICWQWDGNFWDWYFIEKNKREVINFLDQDPDRVWKFRGSLDPCDDIVQKIKTILKL
jgi:hypothetical protein